MNERRTSPATRIVICAAADDEQAGLTPRLLAEGFDVSVIDGPDLNAPDLADAVPHVVIVGSGADLDVRIGLVRQLRRSARAASVRVLWLLRPDDPSSAELAIDAGADDLSTWSGQLDGLVARIHEQAAASSLRRVAEREAALRAELARVDEALDRAQAEREDLLAQLDEQPADSGAGAQHPVPGAQQPPPSSQTPEPLEATREAILQTSRTPALHFGAFEEEPAGQHATVEFSVLERRVVDLLRNHPAGNDEGRPVSVLVVGIDGWHRLIARRGDDLARRLRDAVADLVESLVEDPVVIESLPEGQICVLYPQADEAKAVRLAREVCAQVASAPAKTTPRPLQPTVSVGVSTLERDRAGSPFDLLERASKALMVARRRGGNRWWVYHRSHTH